MGAPGPAQKGMCIATRCTTVDNFVEMFHRFVDEDSFFVSTMNTRPPGLETSFSVQLADGTPVLRGLCVVLQAWTTSTSPFKTPGVRLGIKRLTASSMPVFERLLVTRSAGPPPAPPAVLAAGTEKVSLDKTQVLEQKTQVLDQEQKTQVHEPKTKVVAKAKVSDEPKVVVAEEMRTPGSDLVLPANPLMNLTDESLEGYVDCTLYEETGNFFPADEESVSIAKDLVADDVAEPPPPALAPRPVSRISRPVEVISEADALAGVSLSSLPAAMPMPATPVPMAPPPVPVRRDSSPALPAFSRDSAPAGELATPVPFAAPRRNRMWIVGLGAAALGLAATMYWVAGRGDADAPATKTAAQAPHAPMVAEPPRPAPTPAPEPAPAPIVEAPATPDVEPEPEAAAPSESGDAVAGEGPCKIAVASTPAGSIVHLDGKAVAPSPVTIATSCERHKVEIKHPRYQLATKLVALKEGTPGSLDVTLQRPTHTVSVTSQPSGATVYIDGKRAGSTPTKLSVLGFVNLKLELKKPGYASVSTKLYSKTAQDKLSVKLMKW